jgi:hypothetical protein
MHQVGSVLIYLAFKVCDNTEYLSVLTLQPCY